MMSASSRKRNIVVVLVMVVAVCAIAIAGFKYWDTQRDEIEARGYYDQFTDVVDRLEGEERQTFLEEFEGDCIAWLRAPDTPIDYPVLKAVDYDQYLRHLPNGEYNLNGSLFLDYHCKPDFSDPMSIIYGHNMGSGMMFGTLAGYKNQSYYDQHPIMYLDTPNAQYRIELLYGLVITEQDWNRNGFMLPEKSEDLLSYAQENTTFRSAFSAGENARYVAMKTCSTESDASRYVVIGVLVDESAGR